MRYRLDRLLEAAEQIAALDPDPRVKVAARVLKRMRARLEKVNAEPPRAPRRARQAED